ncbi:MAG: coproporphyrinogen-III oxidase family protein [Micavibrio sp.]|nr:coproporphyrinogen-III oxidase family protein [Micavibrio sp.]
MDLNRNIALAEKYPLDFTLQYPPRREYFQSRFRGTPDLSAAQKVSDMLLYLHVPFCAAKCYFCNFAVDVRTAEGLHQRYTDLLCLQLERLDNFLPRHVRVPGIDIGGGTPTLLEEAQLRQITAALKPWRARTTCEHPLSIETTPRIAATNPERMQALLDGGVTRISMGVQSANAATLQAVNRGLQENMTRKAVQNLRQAGFRRINVDIIFGLPNQTAADWQAEIDNILDLGVDSVTTYDCLYRGKGRALTKRTADKPNPVTYGALYDLSYHMLANAGFHAAYGSVNFSRHAGETGTSPYFEGRLFDHIPYLGAGNYASSQVGNSWWFAPYSTNAWMERIEKGDTLPGGDCYDLPPMELMAKQVLQSLNFGTINTQRFETRFHAAFDDVYADAIKTALAKGWMHRIDTGYGVTPGYFSHMPQIRALFYTTDAITWVADGEHTALPLKATAGKRKEIA